MTQPHDQRASGQAGGKPGCGWLLLGAVLAGLLVQECAPDTGPESAAGAGARLENPLLAPDAVAQCRDFLKLAQDSKVIRARRAPDRIDVDERLWAELPAREKGLLLQAVTCDLWQTAMPAPGKHVVAYGWRSGKRLQMLTSVGMSRE